MTLLKQLNIERAARREELRRQVRQGLRHALAQLRVADRVIVFGSLTKPGHFTEVSDIDLALEGEPAGMTIYQLTALLAEQMGRPVDVVVLSECRFRNRIVREGEVWTLPG
jgi:predicted nucleotidyltransferase